MGYTTVNQWKNFPVSKSYHLVIISTTHRIHVSAVPVYILALNRLLKQCYIINENVGTQIRLKVFWFVDIYSLFTTVFERYSYLS